MSKLRVNSFSISLDGFGAGTNQTLENPLGESGEGLHAWMFPTATFARLGYAEGEGTTGVNNDFAERGFENIGAWILGRNMFGPIRGNWPNDQWKGWWGDNPPYHAPVFVLTNYTREPLTMDGGTTFYFVTDGITSALERAKATAGNKDVRLGGGVSTIRQYLLAGLIDELHIAISPIILGRGENLFHDINLIALGYTVTEHVCSPAATHVVLTKQI